MTSAYRRMQERNEALSEQIANPSGSGLLNSGASKASAGSHGGGPHGFRGGGAPTESTGTKTEMLTDWPRIIRTPEESGRPESARTVKGTGGGGIRTRVRKYIPAGIYDAYPLLLCRSRRGEAAKNRRKPTPENLIADV